MPAYRNTFATSKFYPRSLFSVVLCLLAFIALSSCSSVDHADEVQIQVRGLKLESNGPNTATVALYYISDRVVDPSATYNVGLLVDGEISDSVVIRPEGPLEVGGQELVGRHSMLASGLSVGDLVKAVQEKYKDAKQKYDDFESRTAYDLMKDGLFSKSYDDLKRSAAEEERLKAEMQKWNSVLRGSYLGYNPEVDRLVRRFVRLTVTRME